MSDADGGVGTDTLRPSIGGGRESVGISETVIAGGGSVGMDTSENRGGIRTGTEAPVIAGGLSTTVSVPTGEGRSVIGVSAPEGGGRVGSSGVSGVCLSVLGTADVGVPVATLGVSPYSTGIRGIGIGGGMTRSVMIPGGGSTGGAGRTAVVFSLVPGTDDTSVGEESVFIVTSGVKKQETLIGVGTSPGRREVSLGSMRVCVSLQCGACTVSVSDATVHSSPQGA
ncbi:hypothetical protein OE88DRAFT_755286 [Heliocybe sulcata]|uniref:Uncharacterized protein n=1 Tax=Heliocybe sulcata TaxID=5364 RepID=A0A5C3MR05_9AGAM|nr:hypothetical protein OE88DRAFT_755286 [Heliocybe sulcata]